MNPAVELTITIVPAPDASSEPRSAWVTRRVPSTFTSNIHCQSSILPSSTVSRPWAPPALLTSRVIGPALSAAALSAATDSSEVTSQTTAVAVPPAAVISVTSLSRRSARRAATITAKPAAASWRAVAAPIPLEAPVTIAVGDMVTSCRRAVRMTSVTSVGT